MWCRLRRWKRHQWTQKSKWPKVRREIRHRAGLVLVAGRELLTWRLPILKIFIYLLRTELEQFVVKAALTAETKEMRHLNRVLRHTFAQYRRKWTAQTLAHLILKYFPDTQAEKKFLLSHLPAESIEVRFLPFSRLAHIRCPILALIIVARLVTNLFHRLFFIIQCDRRPRKQLKRWRPIKSPRQRLSRLRRRQN